MTQRSVWLIGNADERCFLPAIGWLSSRARLHRVGDVAAARNQLIESQAPVDAILLCASRPGQFDAHSVEALHRAAPLAHLAMLLGSWCEGEVRSGRVIPGVQRIYWHQWQALLPVALGLEGADVTSRLLASRTASEGDRLEAMLHHPVSETRGLVAVCTRQAASFNMLADALAAGGFQTAWQLPHLPWQVRGTDAIVWDGWPEGAIWQQREAIEKVPSLVLLDFPRWDDRERAIQMGLDEVVSRPFRLPDFWKAVDQTLRKKQNTARQTAAA